MPYAVISDLANTAFTTILHKTFLLHYINWMYAAAKCTDTNQPAKFVLHDSTVSNSDNSLTQHVHTADDSDAHHTALLDHTAPLDHMAPLWHFCDTGVIDDVAPLWHFCKTGVTDVSGTQT